MHKSATLTVTTDEVRELLEEMTHEFAGLDLEYVKLGVAWHRIRPEVRDQLNNDNGAASIYHRAFEHDPEVPNNELPAFIAKGRDLDNEFQQCKAMLRRDEEKYTLIVHQWLHRGLDALDKLWHILHPLRNQQPLEELVQYEGGEDCAVARGEASHCFMDMDNEQRYKFMVWARELREMKAAKELGMSDGFKDVIELVLGNEDRAIIEMPDDLTLDDKIFWPGDSAVETAMAAMHEPWMF